MASVGAVAFQTRTRSIEDLIRLSKRAVTWEVGLVLVTWCLLVAWRPFFLGFYHDDWAVVVGSNYDLTYHLKFDPTRAVFVLLMFFLKAALGGSAFAWQAGLALAMLACSLALYLTCSRLFAVGAFGPSGSKWSGALAASAWMLVPWSHGYAAFPIMLAPVLGALLALLGGLVVLFSGQSARLRIPCFGGALMISGLCYEAFWLSSVSVTLLYAAWAHRTRDMKRAVRETAGVLLVGNLVQIALVVFNRLMDKAHNASQVNAQWPALLEVDRVLLGQQLPVILGDAVVPVLVGLGLMLLAALWSIRHWAALILFAWTAASLGIAVVLVAILYALGGYGLQWIGQEARTSLSPNVWFGVAVALISYYGIHSPNIGRPLFVAGAALMLVGLGRASAVETSAWSEAWRFEQSLLRAVPSDQLKGVGQQFALLVQVPESGAITTFSAYWDVSGALRSTYPDIWDHDVSSDELLATVTRPDMLTRWDGEFVSQAWCRVPGSTLWSFRARRLILWPSPENRILEVTAPYSTGCEVVQP